MSNLESASKKAELLRCLPEAKNITQLAKDAGVARQTIYTYLAEDDDFRQKWTEILEYMTESALDTAKMSINRVNEILALVASNPNHKDWIQAVKEFNRMVERQTLGGGDIELKLNF